MKNVYLLPTDKPSILHEFGGQFHIEASLQENFRSYHIYITNDEEIKTGDREIIDNECRKLKFTKSETRIGKKVILTTDPYLIKDGVQAIDDAFLKWFVKNPSCEEVKIEKEYNEERIIDGKDIGDYRYKIIIPQEKPKQYPIGSYAPGNYTCKCITCNQQFMGDKRAVQCEPCAIEMVEYKPKPNSVYPITPNECFKQETLEEAAERLYPFVDELALKKGFIHGAKWQAEQMYSEEEVK